MYLVVGGHTSSTELLTEGASAWTFAGLVPLQRWIAVVSINNEIITTGECLNECLCSPTNFSFIPGGYYNGVAGIMDGPITQPAYAKFNITEQVWSKVEWTDSFGWLSSTSVVNLEDIIDHCHKSDIDFKPQRFRFLAIFEGFFLSFLTFHAMEKNRKYLQVSW